MGLPEWTDAKSVLGIHHKVSLEIVEHDRVLGGVLSSGQKREMSACCDDFVVIHGRVVSQTSKTLNKVFVT